MAKEIRHLKRFGKVKEIIGMEDPHHYRNKVQAAFQYDPRRHQIISGVYQSGTHRIVPVDQCLIEDTIADEIIVDIRKMMKGFKMTAYNEDTGRGFLRHVLVKRGFSTGQVMVVLVSGPSVFPSRRNFVKALLEKHPEITTVIHNVNPYHTNLVLGDQETVLYGPGYIEDILGGCTFRISAKSFYQINPVQCEKLYATAIDYAGLTGNEVVFDSYCGTGTIGILAAGHAKSVIGVELNRDAVRDAIANAKRNGIDNIEFHAGDAGEFLTAMAAKKEPVDVILMDPPRAGSSIPFLRSLVTLAPPKVVYVSCNPETLARDLNYLTKKGYKVRAIQPVDMFPYTEHVETVVLLTRNNDPKRRIP